MVINTLLVTKIMKKINYYVLCFHNWLHVQGILSTLNAYIFDRRYWNVRKVSDCIKKDFGSKSVQCKNYIKTKIKYYEGKINTDIYGKGIPICS